jgi:hypothetical protein
MIKAALTCHGRPENGKGELDVWHSFKITGGLIRAAEAFCKQMLPSN